jgi:hypothetical protein
MTWPVRERMATFIGRANGVGLDTGVELAAVRDGLQNRKQIKWLKLFAVSRVA